MTILLPGDDSFAGPAGTGRGVPTVAEDIAFADFGARMARPLAPVEDAARRADADGALADAAAALERFVHTLTGTDPDVASWPAKFAAEAKRVRDTGASRLSEGPERDRFDAAFDLFAKAKAVETRSFATHRRVAENRIQLARALDGYAAIAASAITPVSADFAAQRGEAAIAGQADAQVLPADEAAALLRRFRTEIAVRRARRFVADDPDAALRELARPSGGLFADLPAEQRADLRESAEFRRAVLAEAADGNARLRKADTETDTLRRRHAFAAAFRAALRSGTATPVQIADGLDAGDIDRATAARLRRQFVADCDERWHRAEAAAAVEARLAAGDRIDPADPGDASAAEDWFATVAAGAYAGPGRLATGDRQETARLVREARRRLGFLPATVAGTLDRYWNSGDPGLMRLAADAEPDEVSSGDRAAFRALVAAGLPPAAAKAGIAEMATTDRPARGGVKSVALPRADAPTKRTP